VSAETRLRCFEGNRMHLAAAPLQMEAERKKIRREPRLRLPATSNLIALLLFFAETRYCQTLPHNLTAEIRTNDGDVVFGQTAY
jgi:hypothetical protein